MTALRGGRTRIRVRVRGTVQGVGFRPFVYRLAHDESLGGYVLNDQHGVLLEVEGSGARIERFMARLVGELPPLATVEEITAETLATAGEANFRIAASSAGGTPDALVTMDSATCADCCVRCWILRTAGTGIRSRTARTADRGSRSCAGYRTTGR